MVQPTKQLVQNELHNVTPATLEAVREKNRKKQDFVGRDLSKQRDPLHNSKENAENLCFWKPTEFFVPHLL